MNSRITIIDGIRVRLLDLLDYDESGPFSGLWMKNGRVAVFLDDRRIGEVSMYGPRGDLITLVREAVAAEAT